MTPPVSRFMDVLCAAHSRSAAIVRRPAERSSWRAEGVRHRTGSLRLLAALPRFATNVTGVGARPHLCLASTGLRGPTVPSGGWKTPVDRPRAAPPALVSEGRLAVERLRRLDIGALILGVLILGVGIYYLLVNTFGFELPDLDWDMIWPIAVIALGLGILWGAWNRMSTHGHGPTGA